MKKFMSLLLIVNLCFPLFTGCSNKDDLSSKRITEKTVEDGKLTPPAGDYTYIEKGDTVSDFFKYSFADEGLPDEYSMSGYDGLEYTFDDVKVYDSVSASPIKESECEKITGKKSDKTLYKENSFILIDMTATYNKPKSSNFDEIMFRMEFEGTYMIGDGFKEHDPDEFAYPYADPIMMYFSERPQKGDVNLDGNTLNLEDDGNVCRKTLKSGDSIKFQIGVLAKKDLVDEKNVFLYLRFRETPEKGNPVPLVDVLGRYNNE